MCVWKSSVEAPSEISPSQLLLERLVFLLERLRFRVDALPLADVDGGGELLGAVVEDGTAEVDLSLRVLGHEFGLQIGRAHV